MQNGFVDGNIEIIPRKRVKINVLSRLKNTYTPLIVFAWILCVLIFASRIEWMECVIISAVA